MIAWNHSCPRKNTEIDLMGWIAKNQSLPTLRCKNEFMPRPRKPQPNSRKASKDRFWKEVGRVLVGFNWNSISRSWPCRSWLCRRRFWRWRIWTCGPWASRRRTACTQGRAQLRTSPFWRINSLRPLLTRLNLQRKRCLVKQLKRYQWSF